MELILYLIPTAIVVLTIIISKLVRGSFTDYIEDLETKVLEIESVLNLSFMKELLDFFVSSQASKAAERLVNSANDAPNRVSEAVSGAARSSGSEIEKLYGSMKRTLQPSVDLERDKGKLHGLYWKIISVPQGGTLYCHNPGIYCPQT